jgi:protein-tyrosine phosphatase
VPVRSVLFVCAGNICRSPIAEAACRRLASSRPTLADLEIGSAGVVAIDGNFATAEAVEAVRGELGLDITTHRARCLDHLDADLILTMDATVTRLAERATLKGRVVLLGDYAGTGEIVEDPYGRPGDVYLSCVRQIRRLVELAVQRIEAERSI